MTGGRTIVQKFSAMGKMINDELSGLSPHLFWDVDRMSLDSQKNKKFLIQRVLEYGLINDWRIISSYYGIPEIADIACTIRGLDLKAAAFISILSKKPLEEFICYTTRSSTPPHWNF